jgi:hypothetical protein
MRTSNLLVALAAMLPIASALDNFFAEDPDPTPYMEGIWASYKTADKPAPGLLGLAKQYDGPPVETFSLKQDMAQGGMATFGSLSGVNKFKVTGKDIEGAVTAKINGDGTKIEWSHGYTSIIKSPKPIDLEGLWQAYALTDGGEWEPVQTCSVEHRGDRVASYCDKSGLTTSSYDANTRTLANEDGDKRTYAVSKCGKMAVSDDKTIVAKRIYPGMAKKGMPEEAEEKDEAAPSFTSLLMPAKVFDTTAGDVKVAAEKATAEAAQAAAEATATAADAAAALLGFGLRGAAGAKP